MLFIIIGYNSEKILINEKLSLPTVLCQDMSRNILVTELRSW